LTNFHRLTAACSMLKPNVAEGELGAAIEKLNDSIAAELTAIVKESLILSVMIWESISATSERMLEFLDDYTAVLVALKQLDLAIARAIKIQEENADREKAYAYFLKNRALRIRMGYKEKLLVEIDFEKKYEHLYPFRERPWRQSSSDAFEKGGA
jgi:hypothetical protein